MLGYITHQEVRPDFEQWLEALAPQRAKVDDVLNAGAPYTSEEAQMGVGVMLSCGQLLRAQLMWMHAPPGAEPREEWWESVLTGCERTRPWKAEALQSAIAWLEKLGLTPARDLQCMGSAAFSGPFLCEIIERAPPRLLRGMVPWLLAQGHDPNRTDDHDRTAVSHWLDRVGGGPSFPAGLDQHAWGFVLVEAGGWLEEVPATEVHTKVPLDEIRLDHARLVRTRLIEKAVGPAGAPSARRMRI